MITVKLGLDASALADIYAAFSIDERVEGTHFLFYDEETVVGFLRSKITDYGAVRINKIFFSDGVEEGDKEFFVRSVFFKLINAAPVAVEIPGEHPELVQFGFVYSDGAMKIVSSNINLHGKCGH